MARVEPVVDEPAAVVDVAPGAGDRAAPDDPADADDRPSGSAAGEGAGGDGDRRVLAVADYHAGVEAAIRAERGVEVPSEAADRRRTLTRLADDHDVDRVVVLGDFMHSIGDPGGAERGEIGVLLESLPVPVTVVRGNHDGAIDDWIGDVDGVPVTVTDGDGVRIGAVGFAHGHTWPAPEVLGAEAVCIGHEHPTVALVDPVGSARAERVWLRGHLRADPFREREEYDDLFGARGTDADTADGEDDADADTADGEDDADADGGEDDADGGTGAEGWHAPEFFVFPAYNGLSGGTRVNVDGEFLCPFLPSGLGDGEAFLLDGTRLGPYDRI